MLCSCRLTSSSRQRDCRSPWTGTHAHCGSWKLFLANHANRCWGACLKLIECAQHKGTVPRSGPILEYPLPNRPWDVVSIDLLQLPASYQGSKYLLVCVDHLSRYVVLAPLKDKSAKSVAHALITHLFCPYSAPRVLLSDNGAEFRNILLEEISQQFDVKQCFIVTYLASNGLVERANRKILEVLLPVVGELLETWEGWVPQVAASISSSVCASTGQSISKAELFAQTFSANSTLDNSGHIPPTHVIL